MPENTRQPTTVYIGIGSNLGDRAENIRVALRLLKRSDGIRLSSVASTFETEPEGVKEQPRFLNTAACIQTRLTPGELLSTLKDIEKRVGRTPAGRWGPRVMDLDILLYGEKIISGESLTVPHPLMAEREFVLRPMAEIAPAVMHPGLGKTVRELLEEKEAGEVHSSRDGAVPDPDG